jgi:mycoredoxin
MSTAPEPVVASTPATITVYWRPGCAFCSRLLRWLDRTEVPTTRRNIWEDPEAAAVVRAVTGGDETVPTVVVGQHAMVNPSPLALEAAIAAHAPALLSSAAGGSDGSEANDGRGSPGRWWEWRTRPG